MHQATTDQKTLHNHHRALKCIVLLAAVRAGSALKLTPVHHPSRKLLLDQESKSITQAFNEAKELISSEANPSSETSITYLTQNRVIKRLHTSIERWSLIEDRLRSTVSTSDQVSQKDAHLTTKIILIIFLNIHHQIQVSMFDETLSIIAASRVLLGQLFWRSHDNDAALRELEPSCPILWDYDVDKISLDNDVSYSQTSTNRPIHVGNLTLSFTRNLSNRAGWTAIQHSATFTSEWEDLNKLSNWRKH